MRVSRSACVRIAWAVALAGGLAVPASASPPAQARLGAAVAGQPPAEQMPAPRPLPPSAAPAGLPACPDATPIDLGSALKLAGVENPEILIARQRVVEAVTLRQLAAAQILPTLNFGTNYDAHTGPVQQSSGNILKVNRSALYVGAGANAVAAGTVSIPGVVYNLNLSEAVYGALIARQNVARARFASLAVRNDVFRRVANTYTELLGAEGRRSVAQQTRDEAEEVAKMTAVFAREGQAARADADRAATEYDRRQSELAEAQAELLIASARLAELLNLNRPVLLRPAEDRLLPTPVVPEPIPLAELLAIALLQRPELAEKQAAIRQALLALDGAKLLPFSPNMIVGFSSGTFGGGSGLVASPPRAAAIGLTPQPRFGNFGQRNDFDAVMYWTLQNLGMGNLALIRTARSRVGIAELERLEVLNRVRREVAEAYVRVQVRFAQVARTEKAVLSGEKAFREDFRRVRGGVGRPIELLESLRLLAQARYAYLRAIVDYNEAQIDLYVALGQPPADVLARPVPTDFRAPIPQAQKKAAE